MHDVGDSMPRISMRCLDYYFGGLKVYKLTI